jgi:hypothetical protein
MIGFALNSFVGYKNLRDAPLYLTTLYSTYASFEDMYREKIKK